MEFPIFQFPYLGTGMIIALNAVLHVAISHGLAIGAVLFIVISEYLGLKKASRDWEDFARDFLKFTIIITTGIGAVTGVGIWFIPSALSPRGIGSMLRVFFWPWFIEWMVFTCEVIFILAYYFTWEKWRDGRKRRHVFLGVAYLSFAFLSASLITGILGFMLTSDGWPWDRAFWSAFLNPSYLPQLFLRISAGLSIGALSSSAFLLFTRRDSAFRQEALGFFAKAAIISFSATTLSAWWYFTVIPPAFKTHAIFAVLTSRLSQEPQVFWYANGAGVFLLFVTALVSFMGSLRGPAVLAKVLIVPALLVSMAFVAEFERIREFIRGPYLMPGYMYANQMLISETQLLEKNGTLKNDIWFNQAPGNQDATVQGAYLFARNCSTCHTIGGINDIAERVKGRTEDGIFVLLGHTSDMVPFMPPFSGTGDERRTLAGFLYGLSKGTVKLHDPSRLVPLTGGENHG
jgi:mono/diheme cytochrome c family protein